MLKNSELIKVKITGLKILILMLAFSAGLIFFAGGFALRVPKGVTVNGLDVGGKPQSEAVRLVRDKIEEDLKDRRLKVVGLENSYVFAYPEIGYKDNLQALLRSAKKGGRYTAEVTFHLNGLKDIADFICNEESRPVIEPAAIFNAEGEAFTYIDGKAGKRADRVKLVRDITKSLEGGFEDVALSVIPRPCTISGEELRYNTRRLSSYTTYFDGSNADRAHNIRLAAQQINGCVLESGCQFSFNAAVGERSAERGFRRAKIIERGEFVEGIGGGVCQTSTTLYNAALLAGCEITECHAHSLAVSYVPPSSDAMVSGNYFDLKFRNSTGYTLYIRARTGTGYVAFDFYGRGDGAEYSYFSEVKGNIPAPVEVTEDESLVREGRDGIVSEGYLLIKRGGTQIKKLMRRDRYSPIKHVVTISAEDDKEQEKADKNAANSA